ncbi:hypothetical protein DD783_06200 [Helicobacter pylori]|nr:hypothetical protein DD783_06200 [Helicobacter pylori]
MIQPFNHPTIQPFKHSSIQAFKHSIIQSFKHSIKQSSNQAIKQSSNQATLPYFYNFLSFYKNLFKNPLLFIIPSLINPFIPPCINPFIPPCINPFIPSLINPHRNIFKPFDSISPIFKPVGLTELNSIQGEDNGSVRRFKSA